MTDLLLFAQEDIIMQNRMKTHQLTEGQCRDLLKTAEVGALATLGEDGRPYNVPVHFALAEDTVYIHGLPVGEKVDNIRRNPAVCLTVWDMKGYLLDPNGKPCDTNTEYQSVVIRGTASMVEDMTEKLAALHAVVVKYTPQLAELELPEGMIRGTGVIAVKIDEITGKYYE